MSSVNYNLKNKGVRLIGADKAWVKEYKGKTYDLNRAAIIFTVPCGLIVFLHPPYHSIRLLKTLAIP